MTKANRWWQKTTIYQIYPRSYMDSNHDGIGDIQGIISKLDYIKELGFETIWISPFFSSPQQDWGYDVSDYRKIAPEYGDLADVEELVHQIHSREMRVLFDFVLNHTSDKHPWFQESRLSLDNPKRDWYIWQNGRGKGPPNNWKSIVGGSGWNYESDTDQWYYASFLPFQPDLNYRNPAVTEAMFNNARFWLDKGIDGFRLDIFHGLFKDEYFRDNPWSFHLFPHEFTAGYLQRWQYNLNQPETINFAREFRALVDSYFPEKLLLGEIYAENATIRKYLGPDNDGLNLVFLWDLIDLQAEAGFLKNIVRHYEFHYPEPYTPVYVFGNHDRERLMTRIGGDNRKASLLALFQFTSRGVPVTYYGEEIGMSDFKPPQATVKDPLGRRYGWVPDFILSWFNLYLNRDACRTPMQWDGRKHAGFSHTGAAPWLSINPNYKEVNVFNEQDDDMSLLNVYRELLNLRSTNVTLQSGSMELIDGNGEGDNLLAYRRENGQEIVLVLINFGDSESLFNNNKEYQHQLFKVGDYRRSDVGDIILYPLSGLVLAT